MPQCPMLAAIAGDIIGSRHDWLGTKTTDPRLRATVEKFCEVHRIPSRA